MERFFDAHCHYDFASFAGYGGAGHFICNAVGVSDWPQLLSGANAHIHIALGVHPWHVENLPENWIVDLRKLLIQNPSVMVGETGLDALHDNNMAAQYDAFVAQYKMAADLSRAVHIHCVHAWDKMLHVFKELPMPPVVVAHRFSGNMQILSAVLNISDKVYFSYRGLDIERVRGVVAATPLNRILVETDGYAPNADEIRDAILKIAQIHGKSFADMSDIIYKNSLQVINNGQITQNQNVIG